MDLTRQFPAQDRSSDTTDMQPLFDVDRSPMFDALVSETIPNTNLSLSPIFDDMANVVDSSSDHLPTINDSSNNSRQDEDTYDVNPNVLLSSTYQLPLQTTHGKPKVQYKLDVHAKMKYPINNYVFVHQINSQRL